MPAADNTLAGYVESWSPEPLVDEGVRMIAGGRLRQPAFVGEHLLASGVPGSDGAVLRLASVREGRHVTADVSFA